MVTDHDQSESGLRNGQQPTPAPAKKGRGLVRRWLGGMRHEPPTTDGGSGAPGGSALDLADIQGFVLRGYRMPMVRHFLLTVRAPVVLAGNLDGS